MQVISFKHTTLFKRGMWLTAAALIAFVLAPWVVAGGLLQDPMPHLGAVGILSGFWAYFLWRTQIHRTADEVVDCKDHLQVRRGRIEEIVPFSNISKADVSTNGGIYRITLQLRDPAKLGKAIVFLPQASLWSNLSGVQRVASGLTERANQAQREVVGYGESNEEPVNGRPPRTRDT
jgi:hypothetical protein